MNELPGYDEWKLAYPPWYDDPEPEDEGPDEDAERDRQWEREHEWDERLTRRGSESEDA